MKPICLPDHVQLMLDQLANDIGYTQPRMKVVGGSEQGDNYVGQVYRAILHDDGNKGNETLNLIIKCAPQNPKRRELLRTKNLFENEIFLYESVLPELLCVLKKKGIVSKKQQIFPATAKIYLSRTSKDGAEDAIILKDLSPEGFSMADRHAGLDAEHCRLVLRELARLHATSVMLKVDDPDTHDRLVAVFQETLCVPEWESSFTGFADRARRKKRTKLSICLEENCILQAMIDARFPEGTTGRAKFEEFVGKYFQTMSEMTKPDPRLAVFCHGDTWVNNFLYKYEKGSRVPEAACLVDFQLARYSNPVTDIAYMLFCSTTKVTRDKHYKQLLMDYHRFLSTFLKTFGCPDDKIVSWEVMQNLYRKYMKFGLGMAIITIPVFMSKKGDVHGVDEVGDANQVDEIFVDKAGANPARDERISDVLQDMIGYGYV